MVNSTATARQGVWPGMKLCRNFGRKGGALDFAARLYEALNTPTSLGLWLCLKYKDHDSIANHSVDASHYRTPLDYFRDAQAVAVLAKYPDLDTSHDTTAVAYRKFQEAEFRCKLTNERFRDYWDRGEIRPDVAAVLQLAGRKISRILGDVPTLDHFDFRFGPGASLGVRRETSVFNKLTSNLEATASMLPILSEFLAEFPGWVEDTTVDVTIVRGSQLTFVPKNAKTDRPICIEPMLNGLMQKGIGSYLRKRLLRAGCDLNDQTRNQRLAAVAHINGLATLDLSSASDCISHSLVLDLIPEPWFELLNHCRCPRYFYEGKWRTFEKFSSMGNAYTFELESLIFLALSRAVCEINDLPLDSVGVYGDDIIVPKDCVPLLEEVLAFCGFQLNMTKSFSSGVFYESCGEDFFMGLNVRPLFLKRRLVTVMDGYYAANFVSRVSKKVKDLDPHHFGVGRCSDFRDIHSWLVDAIPRRLRNLGPEGYGDGHIIADFDHATPARAPRGWDGWVFHTAIESAKLVDRGEWPKAYALYHAGLDASASAGYAIRGVTRIRRRPVICKSWDDIGRWS